MIQNHPGAKGVEFIRSQTRVFLNLEGKHFLQFGSAYSPPRDISSLTLSPLTANSCYQRTSYFLLASSLVPNSERPQCKQRCGSLLTSTKNEGKLRDCIEGSFSGEIEIASNVLGWRLRARCTVRVIGARLAAF